MTKSPEEQPLTVEPVDFTIDSETHERATKAIILVPEGWPVMSPKEIYIGSTESVIKLAKTESLPFEILSPAPGPLALRENRAADWVAPTMFISSLLLTDNPTLVSVALNVLSNYITDGLKGLKSDPTVKLQVIHHDAKTGNSTRVKYVGPVSGLKEVAKTISKLGAKK